MRQHALRYVQAGRFLRLAWTEWGAPDAPPVVCVHGLTRTGRDFDELARGLAADFRVICPDLPGRGRSDWLPASETYAMPVYVQALSHLLAHIGRPVGWVGTSLGGLCGMAIAAMPEHPIRRLVLNDIGPFLPAAALARIAAYMGAAPQAFDDLAAVEAALRLAHAPFGRLSDAQWAAMAAHSVRSLPDGRLALHYDPRIGDPMRAQAPADIDLWPQWETVRIARLVLRGIDSDLLLPDTFARMMAEGAQGHVVQDAGHAPALMDPPTIDIVRAFLLAE